MKGGLKVSPEVARKLACEYMSASPVFMAAFKQASRVDTWRKMMAGDVDGWCEFFRMIETGESRLLLREHVKYG